MKTAQTFLRRIWPFAFGAVCLWLLSEQVDDVDYGALWASVLSATPWQWGLALTFSAISMQLHIQSLARMSLKQFFVEAHDVDLLVHDVVAEKVGERIPRPRPPDDGRQEAGT